MPKEFLTYQQQMEKLRSSGLAIEGEEACCRVLADIGYFPVVNGHQSFFRDPSTRVYREGATFGDILALYEFDVELRLIMSTKTAKRMLMGMLSSYSCMISC